MMYGNCYFHLQAALNREERAKLAAKIRRNRNIIAVTVDECKVHIWYKRQMTAYQLQEIQKMLIETVKRLQEAAITPSERLAEYRRDAVISLAGFAAMEVLKRTSPQLFVGSKILRSLLVLGIARKFIQNGVSGVVKDHQPNADTLTATAVIASVLAGKPESSLTLLALSNGAEMLTSYAAERPVRISRACFLLTSVMYGWWKARSSAKFLWNRSRLAIPSRPIPVKKSLWTAG